MTERLSLSLSLWFLENFFPYVKESTCKVEDLGLKPEFGRSSGEGKGYPLQYSSLENSMDYIYSLWGHKESDITE